MDKFIALGEKYNIPIIEDCAQAYLAEYKGKYVGTMGAMNAFSLNHFKHITAGSGGMILTNDDSLRKLGTLYTDKCYDREAGKRNPFFLAPNYQMTELQGAVALAQLEKLQGIIERRRELGNRLTNRLKTIDGVIPQLIPDYAKHTYFMFLFRLDFSKLSATAEEFSTALTAEGIPSQFHTITGGMCEYQYDIFKNRSAFPNSQHPFVNSAFGTDVSYPEGLCPVAEKAFTETINLSMSEFYTDQDIEDMATAIEKVAKAFLK